MIKKTLNGISKPNKADVFHSRPAQTFVWKLPRQNRRRVCGILTFLFKVHVDTVINQLATKSSAGIGRS